MVPGTEVLGAPGWFIPPVSGGFIPPVLRLVLESEPVPDPMPVVVVGRLPGTDEMPGEPGFVGVVLTGGTPSVPGAMPI
jgi:hypothetical protein